MMRCGAISAFLGTVVGLDEHSMLQLPAAVDKALASDDSECRCPGYYQEQCEAEAAQGCVWSAAGDSNEPWCQCGAVPEPPVCCQAMTASCLSCQQGTSEEAYCAMNPGQYDCPPAPTEPISVTLWSQHLGERIKCNDNVDMQYVESQEMCQALAEQAGHPFYSFRHNGESQGHKCMSSAHCDEPMDDRTNDWHIYTTVALTGQADTKCPHNHDDRLFRNPEGSGSNDVTLEQCYEQCRATAGCNSFSHGAWQGGFVCMGCTTLANAQHHAGFTAYNM